jgi:hypothetical protein
MAHPFIAVYKSKGIEYASVCTPARENGKKVNNPVYLGRVLNLTEGRFRNKARGEFLYSLENGYSTPPIDPKATTRTSIAKGALNFGHVYCVHSLLERLGLLKLFRETEESSPDTLLALVMHRLLSNHADSHAKANYNRTYSSILYPLADLTSQGISRYLIKLGSEAIRRDFHMRYISMMYPDAGAVGVLIDSTGLPNDIHLPITAISNHGGGPVNEIRLIYVVDRETLNPIYYRAIPGNIVDVSTLKGTIDELKSMHVNVGYSILDAGYNSESNIEKLFSLNINFMTRLISNRGLYKELMKNNCDTIRNACNRLAYNERGLYMTMNNVKLANNRDAYAYIGLDVEKMHAAESKLIVDEDPKKRLSDEEFERKRSIGGMFVMISSIKMDREEVLPYYYSRQTIEQIFDTSKNFARLLPLAVHSRDAFNGHLLLSFMTTIVYLKLQRIFHKKKYNPVDFITELECVMCGVYEDHLHVYEPTAQQKEILKILRMELPTIVPLAS